jgi:hypothetical protein
LTDEASAPDGAGADALATITPAISDADGLSLDQAFEAYNKRSDPPAEAADAPADPELVQANADPETAPSEDPEAIDPAVEPPIEPPRSWTKEAKERFESLPRDTQEYLAAREQERDREVRRSQNEAAETRKAVDVERKAAEQARQQYESQLPALMQTLQDAQNGSFADVRNVDDVTKLANEDPFRYLQWQAHQTKLQAVNAEVERSRAEQTRQEQAQWNDHIQRENALAAEYIPELADKTKAAALTSRAAETLSELGFTDAELTGLVSGKDKLSLYDHRIQRLIFGNMKLADIQKAKTAVATKPVPNVQRPGVTSNRGDSTQQLTSKLSATGSVDDAFALYQARRSGR